MALYREEEHWFDNGGKKIYGLSYIPDTGKDKYPVIIICPGFTATYRDNLNCAERYAEAGFAVCSFDFCGGSLQSKSDGSTKEMSVMTEVSDVLAVFSQVKELPFADPQQITLWGESLGGIAAALAVTKLTDQVKALVLFYPAFMIPDACRAQFASRDRITPYVHWDVPLGKCYAEDVWDLSVYDEIGKYEGPVLLLHGTEDDVVPISYSERACEVYKNVTYRTIPGAGHGFFNETGEKADRIVVDFLNSQIRERAI